MGGRLVSKGASILPHPQSSARRPAILAALRRVDSAGDASCDDDNGYADATPIVYSVAVAGACDRGPTMTDSTSEGKLRIAIYARVSGEEQTIGRNIEAQVAELKDSIPASHRLVGIYMDDGVSGSVPLSDRPEGSRLMLDAAAGRFDQVLATRLDRVSRNNLDLRQLADSLASMGIKLAAQGMVYGPDPMGRLLLSQLGSIAEFERDLIKERTISGKRYKARTMG
ncbi:MAG: recombinase family protein, partial [Chloroflexi bacterium]